ncbi:MAG: NfeD family protein [Verrucomicrobiota bacterium]
MEWLVFGLLIIGLLLLWAEFYLPGGLLGVIACGLIVAGLGLSFFVFPPILAAVMTIVVILLVCILMWYWMKTFHRSFFGKRIMLTKEIEGEEVTDALAALVGKTGKTTTKLHPSGKAIIDDQKIDAVAERGVIGADVLVQVVKVDGIQVLVRPAAAE